MKNRFSRISARPAPTILAGTFRKEKQRSKPLLRFFARASRPVTAKTRGARPDDKSFVRGPKGELVPFADHESERQRICAACRAKGYRCQPAAPSRGAKPWRKALAQSPGAKLRREAAA